MITLQVEILKFQYGAMAVIVVGVVVDEDKDTITVAHKMVGVDELCNFRSVAEPFNKKDLTERKTLDGYILAHQLLHAEKMFNKGANNETEPIKP